MRVGFNLKLPGMQPGERLNQNQAEAQSLRVLPPAPELPEWQSLDCLYGKDLIRFHS